MKPGISPSHGSAPDLVALVLEWQRATHNAEHGTMALGDLDDALARHEANLLAWHPAALDDPLGPEAVMERDRQRRRQAERMNPAAPALRNFEELRAQMPPEAQARATAETERLRAALPPVEADTK